jgi:predicted nucleic acid-binding protein
MNLVLDTNVLIAAFIAKGVCHRLVGHCLRSHQVIADDNVLGTAIAGNAVCIVTGDKNLLSLNPFQSVDILAPAEFSTYEERLLSG